MPANLTPADAGPGTGTVALEHDGGRTSFGEHSMNRVRGGQIIRAESTSSIVTGLRNIASGLSTP